MADEPGMRPLRLPRTALAIGSSIVALATGAALVSAGDPTTSSATGLTYECISHGDDSSGDWTAYWPEVEALVGPERMKVVDPDSLRGRWIVGQTGIEAPVILVREPEGEVVDLIADCMNTADMRQQVRASEAGLRGRDSIAARLEVDPQDTDALLELYRLQSSSRSFGSKAETRIDIVTADPTGTSEAMGYLAMDDWIAPFRALTLDDDYGLEELIADTRALPGRLVQSGSGASLVRNLVAVRVLADRMELDGYSVECLSLAWEHRTPELEPVLRAELLASPHAAELLEICAELETPPAQTH